jgi:hypothetical protein
MMQWVRDAKTGTKKEVFIENKALVQKLWSLNPEKFKWITIDKALKDYADYINAVRIYSKNEELETLSLKTFKEWLETEI